MKCLCTGGIDQTDTTVKYACTELGVIHSTVHAIRIPGCVYGKGVRAKIVSFTHISYNDGLFYHQLFETTYIDALVTRFLVNADGHCCIEGCNSPVTEGVILEFQNGRKDICVANLRTVNMTCNTTFINVF